MSVSITLYTQSTELLCFSLLLPEVRERSVFILFITAYCVARVYTLSEKSDSFPFFVQVCLYNLLLYCISLSHPRSSFRIMYSEMDDDMVFEDFKRSFMKGMTEDDEEGNISAGEP